jgi:cytoskeletal protein CcmA (bactofilin family)
MWKRDEAAKPGGQSQPSSAPAPVTPAAPPVAAAAARPQPITSVDTPRGLEKTVNIGKSVIEGQVEGKIELRQNVLTIGPNGKIKAQVFAKSVIILGEVTGNVTATEKVDIRDNGSVDGDITAPRVAIAEGAHFRGSIDMQRAGAKPGESKPAEKAAEQKAAEQKAAPAAQPAAQPTPAGASR